MYRIFIDGQAGTTGLQIHALLRARADIELLEIDATQRKNDSAKLDRIRQADLVILCLPDDAAREVARLASGLPVKILDASTAHRVSPEWVYGLPELAPGQRAAIRGALRVSNPGCYPTGFLLAIAPLVRKGIIPPDALLTVNAVSGYSGGGRKLIERYQAPAGAERSTSWALRPYALNLAHKHIPEMQAWAGLTQPPLFVPAVADYYQGMLVQIPLFNDQLPTADPGTAILQTWEEVYQGEPLIRLHPLNDHIEPVEGYLDPELNNGSNYVDLFCYSSKQHTLLIARLDNLGKGAAGAAVQNLNLMLGCEELTGLQSTAKARL